MGKLRLHRWVVMSCLILFLFGCSDSTPLERTQARQKVSLSGTFLTESPDEISFPVKVLFALDCSLSMWDPSQEGGIGSDPDWLRFQATRNFFEEYNSNDNVSFSVLLWSESVFEYTRNGDGEMGFTKDPDEINRVLAFNNNRSVTDYLGTLDAIQSTIQNDINRTEDEENLIRTQYIVVFFSDGMANLGGNNGGQDDDEIWDRVENLYEYCMGDEDDDPIVGNMAVHTFLLTALLDARGNTVERNMAETTLQGMAQEGHGQYHALDTPEAIDFINVIDMRLTTEYFVKYMVAFNYNVRPGLEVALLDSDGDGLPDDEELVIGTNPDISDSDGDGMNDYLEVRYSTPQNPLDPNTPEDHCFGFSDGGEWPDTDMDGLNDCAEYLSGTQRFLPDTDNDGIPDGIEFEMSTNMKEDLETKDADYDGNPDWLEVQQHTNVTSNDPIYRSRYAYNYDIQDQGLVEINQGTEMASHVREYAFTISNIDVMDTNGYSVDGTVLREPGNNLIRLYIAQVPEDSPNLRPLFRMAEVTVNTSTSERDVVLTPADFQLLQ